MFKIAIWNIRGSNDPLKQVEVSSLIRSSEFSIIGLVETHVQSINASRIRNKIMPKWHFIDNYNNDDSGRIWIGWNLDSVKVSLIHSSSQVIFVEVDTVENISFVAAFVYENNDGVLRRALWTDITAFSQINSKPWIVLGDFNSYIEAFR